MTQLASITITILCRMNKYEMVIEWILRPGSSEPLEHLSQPDNGFLLLCSSQMC
jgi:hypothetical protein